MWRVLLGLVVVGLLVYSLADLAGSEEEDRGGIPRWLWILIIVLLVRPTSIFRGKAV